MNAPNDTAASPDATALRGRDPNALETLMLYRMSRSAGWTAFFAFVIAAALIVGGYVYWQQLTILQQTLEEVQDLSEKLQQRFTADAVQSAQFTKAIEALTAELARGGAATSAATVAPTAASKPDAVPVPNVPQAPAVAPPAAATPAEKPAPEAAPKTESAPAPAPPLLPAKPQ